MITHSVVKWPGCVHDSRIFAGSSLKRIYEGGKLLQKFIKELCRYIDAYKIEIAILYYTLCSIGNNGVLLGDSAYQLTHYMLTPYEKETSPKTIAFNKAHRKTRTKVEHTLGIMKGRQIQTSY